MRRRRGGLVVAAMTAALASIGAGLRTGRLRMHPRSQATEARRGL
ncbi:hypothetical protein LG3211_4387 [Lysobacter gummosus]|nr:hypothetical protein LG3211_4387 [Lysobacter gummosus]